MNKKLIASLLGMSLLAGSLVGCSGGNNNNGGVQASDVELSAPGQFPLVEERQKFTILAPDVAHIPDLNTSEFIKWYEDYTNIDVEFVLVPEESFVEKRNLMIASGQLPDAILYGKLTKVDELTYGDQGLFIPLNDLIDEHGYYTKQVFEQQEMLPAGITTPDGTIYSLPRINEAFHSQYSGKAWINQEWLDNLGLDYPETTEEYYEVLKAFKTQDPNGNGIADEIPLVGANNGWNTRPFDFLMNSFVYNDYSSRLKVDNGTVGFAPATEEWREGLRFVKRLMDEGLMMKESLTQTGDQLMMLANNPDTALVGSAVGGNITYAAGDREVGRSSEYKALAPLEGPEGVRLSKYSPITYETGHFVITSSCKNPELLFKWADGLYNEEVTIMSERGREGEEWVKAEEGAIAVGGGKAEWMRLPDDPNVQKNATAQNVILANLTKELRLSEAVDTTQPDYQYSGEMMLHQSTVDYYAPYTPEETVPSSMYLTPEELNDYSRLKTQLQDYVLESSVSFLTGALDLDKDWDTYVKNLNNLDLVKYVEIVQAAYDRTK